MYSLTVTRPKLQTAVLKWFISEEYSFEQETVLQNSAAAFTQGPSGGLLDIGVIVGRLNAGTSTAAANAGNTGNGTMSAVTDQVGIQVGAYAVEFIAATKFNVNDPLGNLVAEGTTGVAFANQVGFTITAGGTAFVAGDGFTITVAANANAGLIVPLNLAAIDGSQLPIGVIVRQTVVPASANVPAVVVERFAVLLQDGLIYPSGATTNQQAAINAQLKALGLIVRTS
jgi:Bacteriophage lambda head decoration protein D